MVVRGICCILPQVPGKTENLRIVSVVGRYLEHSRIYVFGTGDDAKIYLSSADFMTRNTQHRVEVAVPVYDPDARKKALQILELCLTDNTKARLLTSDGQYVLPPQEGTPVDCQQQLLSQAEQTAPASGGQARQGHPLTWLQSRFHHLFH